MSDRDTLTEALKRTRLPGVYQDLVAVVMEGWRPPAREITDPAALEALPVGSIVVDFYEAGCTRISPDPVFGWVRAGSALASGRHYSAPHLPVTVLYVPTEDPDCPHDSRSGAADGRWRCDQCGADCGPNTYLTQEADTDA
ncbi:hypothetical protein ACFVH4_18930 [Nocardia ignorata]|uniref:hypothetical protein n=1 Tax=Nocardia ignorata TaxID=145285 RepID=UPI003640E461